MDLTNRTIHNKGITRKKYALHIYETLGDQKRILLEGTAKRNDGTKLVKEKDTLELRSETPKISSVSDIKENMSSMPIFFLYQVRKDFIKES